MKTTVKVFLILAAAVSVASCKIYDDSDVLQEPAYMVVCNTYEDCISEIFKVAEISDFFSRYQEIRSDREAALELARSYFSYLITSDDLYYEEAVVSGWGRIVLNGDGSFTVYTRHFFWSGHYGGRTFTYHVTPSGGRTYSLALEETDGDIDLHINAEVSCDDDWVTLENCSVLYTPGQKDGYAISSVKDSPVRRVMVDAGQEVYQASSGSLSYSYCLDGSETDDFILSFGDLYVSIRRDGRVAKCKPLASYGGWDVDYVLEIE